MAKDIYSVRDDGYGFIQIRKNNHREVNIVAIVNSAGCGQFVTDQDREQAKEIARKIVKALNN